jgi:hypothetical protein
MLGSVAIAQRIRQAAWTAVVLATACRESSPARVGYQNAVAAAEAPLEEALRRFEAVANGADRSVAREAAGRALAQARTARESLEALAVPPGLTVAWREELLFLNHVIPAFQRFASGGGGPAELEALRSVLQRGRAHQSRGREASVSR